MLYLCPTPIGNLKDITFRVLETLKEVDLIAAEDTRNTLRLLNHFEIKKPLTSYHEYNKYDKARELADKLHEGARIALVTDAGTPGISDPGEVLVRLCRDEGIGVTSLPGACAAVTALSGSGLSSRRFVFEGFLPQDKKEREETLSLLREETRTVVLYEAPHRMVKTLKELYNVLGERELALCRELTKVYEESQRTTLSEALALYEAEAPRGEFVLILSGKDPLAAKAEREEGFRLLPLSEHMQTYLSQGYDEKESMKLVAKDRGLSKRDIYKLLLEARSDKSEIEHNNT